MRKRTVIFAVVAVCFIASLWAQKGSQTTTGRASAPGTCNVANSGSIEKVVIECGIGAQQGQQILAILNKILQNDLKLDLVLQKLDEMAKNQNPNQATHTRNCEGISREVGPTGNSGLAVITGGTPYAYEEMRQLGEAHKILDLLNACSRYMTSQPDWLTPVLFCSSAQFALGNRGEAVRLLQEYTSKRGTAYSDGVCPAVEKGMEDYLGVPTN